MKKIAIIISTICLMSMTSTAQVGWSSVGLGIPTSYTAANVLYNNPNNGNLLVGTTKGVPFSGDTLLFSWNGTILSKYSPKLNYNQVISICSYNNLFCQSGTSTSMHNWDYSSSTWTTGLASSTIVDSTFGNLYLINSGYPVYYNGTAVNTVPITGFSLLPGQSINKGIVVKNTMGDTVYYCGRFSTSTNTNNAVSYSSNGVSWTNIPSTGLPLTVLTSMAVYNGTIIVGGSTSPYFWSWSNSSSTWIPITGIGSPTATVRTLKVYDGKLYGSYNTSTTTSTMFSYDGISFSNVGTSTGGNVSDMNTYGTMLYIVGTFTSVNSVSNTNHIARYNSVVITTEVASYVDHVEMSIYPNPSNGQFTIDAGYGNSTVDVINNLGQTVSHSIIDGKTVLSIEAPGVYFIQVNKNGKVFNSRLINQ